MPQRAIFTHFLRDASNSVIAKFSIYIEGEVVATQMLGDHTTPATQAWLNEAIAGYINAVNEYGIHPDILVNPGTHFADYVSMPRTRLVVTDPTPAETRYTECSIRAMAFAWAEPGEKVDSVLEAIALFKRRVAQLPPAGERKFEAEIASFR